MHTEFIQQYDHIWRVFAELVRTFDADAWLHTGRDATTPARLSLHILQSTKYYLEDVSELMFASGKPFDCNSMTTPNADLPSQNDILDCIETFRGKTECWLAEMDYASTEHPFDWAGATRLGVALFLLKHSVYHLGELSSLLNESKHGEAEDIYVKALNQP
ncbi:MAG: hypothetical protein JXB38_17715 [Anaerolineales bacterium]|nr:hypothetical protein [Anaerolineales bacterium]